MKKKDGNFKSQIDGMVEIGKSPETIDNLHRNDFLTKPGEKKDVSPFGAAIYNTYDKNGHPIYMIICNQKDSRPNPQEDDVSFVVGSMINPDELYPNSMSSNIIEKDETGDIGRKNSVLLVSEVFRFYAKNGNFRIVTENGDIELLSNKDIKIDTKNDLKIHIKNNTEIKSKDIKIEAKKEVLIEGKNITVKARNVDVEAKNVTIDSKNIKLGKGAIEGLVKENFITAFNTHTHDKPTPPATQIIPSSVITKKVKAE